MDVSSLEQYKNSVSWANYIVERGTYDEVKGKEVINWCAKHLKGQYHIGYFVWFESLEDKVKYILKWM